MTGAADQRRPVGRAPRDLGLTDLDAVLTTLSLRNLAESLADCVPAPSSVLLAGSGLPVAADVLANAGHQVLAIDASPAVLETVTGHEQVTVRVGDLVDLPAEDHTIDLVVLLDATSDLGREATDIVLDEVTRVLSASGVVAVSAPAAEPSTDLLPHQLGARWAHVQSHRQVDVGGFALLGPDVSTDPSHGSGDVVAGRPLTGVHRWLYLASDRAVPAPRPLLHMAPGVPSGLTAGMHELLAEQGVAARRVAELEARVQQLSQVQARLVAAEQAAGRARETEAALVDSRARIEELLGMIDTILRSTSWRVTEPVRRASGMARSMSNKLALETLRETIGKYRQSS